MSFQEKMLGQARPASTSAASLYSPGSGVTGIVRSLFVANTSGSVATFRLFVDNDGTTYDETTAIFWDVAVPGEATVEITTFLAMNNASGNLAVRSSVANALTFTAFGAEA